MGNVMIFDHPLIRHKIGLIRDQSTNNKLFRELTSEIAMLMAYEVTRDLRLAEAKVQTPICEAGVMTLEDDKIAVIPILRAGLGMLGGVLTLLPNAKVGHIGMFRDHDTLKPVAYYCNVPKEINSQFAIVLDPMLATGGSAIAAIGRLKSEGIENVRFMCLIASKTGIEALQKVHPDVNIYAAALDEELNSIGYIVPGLGDAGDRLFGTK